MKAPGTPTREVLPSGPAAPFQRTSASGADFGSQIGEAMMRSGAQGLQAADEMARSALAAQGLKNEAEAKDADIAATRRLIELQYNPETGFMNTKGKNAVDGYRTAAEAAEKIRSEALESLKSPEAKRMADRVLASRVQSALQSMASHTGVENRNWQLGTSDSRAITELDAASLAYNDDVRFEQALKTARGEAASQGEMQGWDAATTKLRVKQYEDAGWTKRLNRQRMQDPAGALATYQRNQERISADVAAKLGESLFKDAAPVLAAQLNAIGGAPIAAGGIGKKAPGELERGNIDIGKRPAVKNKDGTTSTIRSMSFNEGGQQILLPSLTDEGAQLTEQQAIDAYRATGRHLGKFDSPENATAFAKRLSNEQGKKFEPQPRGVRNNNPGNIILGPVKWQGEVEGTDPKYASFTTPEDGIRALGKNLLAYGERGLTTVDAIVNRWAPSVENDTRAYIATVAKDLGVDPQQPLNLRDRKVLTNLATSIIKAENGKAAASAYTDEQIATGIGAALDGKPIPTDPKAITGRGGAVAQPTMLASIANMTATDVLTTRTGNPTIDNLPGDQKIQVFQLARTQANQGIAQAREVLKGRVLDTAAALERGMDAPNRPTPSELITVFGQYEGMKIDQELGNAQAFGNDIRTVGTLPLSQQAVLLAARAPQPGEGFATAQKRQEQLGKAIELVNKDREQDPSLAVLRTSQAVQAAFKDLSKLMSSKTADPAERAQASQAYAAASLAEQQRLEITNQQILPKSMVDAIAKQFATPPGEGADAASVMRGMVEQWGKYWPMVGKQLAKGIPAGAVVIGLGVKPEAEQLIAEALKMKPEALRQGINPDDQKALKELVTKEFQPLQRTLAWQIGGQETYDNYADTADSLAVLLLQKGMKPRDAAAKAFESMAGFKYEFEDTWRVPKSALGPGTTASVLRGGAHAARFDAAESTPLRVPSVPGAGARAEDLEKQWRDTVRDNGFWVTSPGDGGLSLYVKSGLGAQPVLNADGSPLRRTWADLGQLANQVRAARFSDVYKKGVRAP